VFAIEFGLNSEHVRSSFPMDEATACAGYG